MVHFNFQDRGCPSRSGMTKRKWSEIQEFLWLSGAAGETPAVR